MDETKPLAKIGESISFHADGMETRVDDACRLIGSRAAAAAAAGVSPQMLSRYIKGEAIPSFKVMVKLAQAANVSLDWIATGQGPMLSDADKPPSTSNTATPKPVDFQVEKSKRLLESDKGPWVGKGGGGLSQQQLMEKAMVIIGELYIEQDWDRDPQREAMMASLLVRAFEIKGFSKETADELLKLIA